MFKVGEIVKYAPQYCGEGEQYYIHEVKEANDGRYLISTLNTMLTLGSTQRVTEDMIQKASKYEVITWHGKYIVTDTESKKFFAGYDFMGSVEWVDNQDEAEANELEYAEQYKADLESADEPAEPEEQGNTTKTEIIVSIRKDRNYQRNWLVWAPNTEYDRVLIPTMFYGQNDAVKIFCDAYGIDMNEIEVKRGM